MKCSVQSLTTLSNNISTPAPSLAVDATTLSFDFVAQRKKKSLVNIPRDRDRIMMLLLPRRPTVIQNRVFSLRWSESAGPTETPLCHLCLTDAR